MMACKHIAYLCFLAPEIAAFMLMDLHYQDARSRLSGMNANSTPFILFINHKMIYK